MSSGKIRVAALRLVRAGHSLSAAAHETGSHRHTVAVWCDMAGVARPRYRHFPEAVRSEAVARVAAGETLHAIARAYGTNASLVWRWCERRGVRSVQRRGPGRSKAA